MDRRQVLGGFSAAVAGLTGAQGASRESVAGVRTFGGIGKEREILEPGVETEVFRQDGAGCLTHMWFAMDERTRVRAYVDGEPAPSIDMRLDLGHGYDRRYPYECWGVRQVGRTGGAYNTYRIPFEAGVRLTVLPPGEALDGVTGRKAWWVIRGSTGLSVSLGGVRLPTEARLRLHTLEDYRAAPLEEFAVCTSGGSGALYQVTLSAAGDRPHGDWRDQSYQECCVRAYIGGSPEPLMLSSGLEDYFLGSGYFHHGRTYHTPIAGLTHIDRDANRFTAYRFHDEDPVFFESGLRLTLRCGEELDGRVFHDPPSAVYSAYAWVYEW